MCKGFPMIMEAQQEEEELNTLDYTQTHKYIFPNLFKQAKLLQLWNLLRKGVMPIIPLKRGKLHIRTFPRGEA
jgi:hypothetical protein